MIITEETIQLLQSHNIFGTHDGSNRFKVGDRLDVVPEAIFEPDIVIGWNSLPTMGAFSFSWSYLPPLCKVGRYNSVAVNVQFCGDQHPYHRFTTSSTYMSNFILSKQLCKFSSGEPDSFRIVPKQSLPNMITIENDVWIGKNVTLKQGITIGTGSIIAGGAIVTKDVEPYTIVGGVPAKFIKHRFPMEIISELMQIKWWKYNMGEFNFPPDIPIEEFIDKMYTLIANNKIHEYKPKVLTGAELIKTGK